MTFLLLIITLICVVLLSWILLILDSKKITVPGNFIWPVLGNGYEFLVDSSEFLKVLARLGRKYNDAARFYIMSARYIVLSHPKYIEPIVSSSELISKGKAYSFLHDWLGDGLLTSTGEKWRSHRKFLTPAFHFNILQNFMPVFVKNEIILRKKLRTLADGSPINVFPIIALHALDNVAESIMGVSVHAQENSESNYVKAVSTVSNIVSSRIRNLFLANETLFQFSPQKKQQDEALIILHGQTRSVIEQRKEELKLLNKTSLGNESELGIRNRHAFLDLLLLAENDGQGIDEEKIREEVDTFMFEGHDTTTSGISFCLYNIAKHKEVQNKLYAEIKAILGDDMNREPTFKLPKISWENDGNFKSVPNFVTPIIILWNIKSQVEQKYIQQGALKNRLSSEIREMKYLDLVIKESLRLHPSVPLIQRVTTKDTDIGGLRVTKNTNVIINIFEMHRNEKIYDNPLEFNPERTVDHTTKNVFSWIPFSAGPRNCIGQKYALLEMKVTISGIVRHFELLPSEIEPKLCADLILRSKNGVYVKMLPRS